MSGVCGTNPIQSREDFNVIFEEYLNVIKGFKYCKNVQISGSYNSNLNKTTFGDMDLIVTIDGDEFSNDKKLVKKELIKYLSSNHNDKLDEFIGKYQGKKWYNSGEIVTIAYKSNNKPSCQIDNIIALSDKEAEFKLSFLNLPAEKQGLILGLVKTALHEQNQDHVFKIIGIKPSKLNENQEYEFNLSSKELQLRIVNIDPISNREVSRKTIWTSTDWDNVRAVLYTLNLEEDFETLIKLSKRVFKSERAGKRIKGVFNSMITVKSGEVGKPKGVRKEECRDLISKSF